MRSIITALILAVGFMGAAGVASADFFSISADLPVSFSFDEDDNTESVSGYKIGVILPFFGLGLGVESYKVKGESDPDLNDESIDVDFNFIDVFIDLPVPVINLVLGFGVGSTTIDPDSFSVGSFDVEFDGGSATQFFASLGIPVLGIFDVHVGYHKINAKGDFIVKSGGSTISDESINLDGTMISIGARIGF